MEIKNSLIQLILIVFLTTIYSCNNVSKSISVKEFDSIIKDTLAPKKYSSYTSYIITIKGYTNDSSYIKPCGSCNKFFISGEFINEKFIFDYYGENIKVFEFNPFKATVGELDIELSIQ